MENNSLLNSLPFQGKEATRGFTLVELIVVITILAILGTIAFISLQGYSTSARDSTRISDLSAMKTSLELFQLDAGKYPETTSGFTVTYSGSEVWTQGTFGETTKSNVEKLDKIPKDPLTEKEYTYSITKTKQEYQLAGLVEGDLAYNPLLMGESITTLVNQTNAAEIIATAVVTGNYNGQTLKTETGVICEILSIPSIISSETATTDLKTILDNKSLVYNGFNNLPSNYEGSKYKTDKGFEFTSEKLVVYSDNQECKPLYDTENATARINLVKNLQTAYSGTLIENSENIRGLVNLDVSDTDAINLLSATLVNNNLGGNIIVNSTNNTLVNACSIQPGYTGATYEIGVATEPNQAWQSSNSNNPCYWTCGIGKVLDENTCVSETCSGTTPDGTAKVSNATSFAGGTWVYNTNPGKCTYSCGTLYHTEDNNNCITNTKSCTITHGIGEQTWNGTSRGACIATSCTDLYTGTNCEIAPITDWRSKDPNCDLPDITIGTQTWAGCNSTLGTGIEYTGTQACYNYVGGLTTGCNRPSNEKENVYNPTYGINNIWGKLYIWSEASKINGTGPCRNGYHLPTDVDWTILENNLAGTTCRTITGWQCDGLGWAGHKLKTDTNNIVNALKLPLAGYRKTDGATTAYRGYFTYLWSFAPSGSSAYFRQVDRDKSSVYSANNTQAFGFSVRCLKD